MKIAALVAALVLVSAFSLPVSGNTSPLASVPETVAAFCAPLGPRHALSTRGRQHLRISLREIRDADVQGWETLSYSVRSQADRIIERGYQGC